jgi:dienelactone hydrolase
MRRQDTAIGFGMGVIAALAAGLAFAPRVAGAAEPDSSPPQVVTVSQTFNQKPFQYQILDRTEKTGFSVYRLKYPSPLVTAVAQNNAIPAEYYVPAGLKPGDPKRPAVICLHILDGNMELVRLTCSVLASRGVPAILFLLPYYGERGLPEGPEAMAKDPRMFLSALDQAMLDVKRTVDVLASRPEVDGQRIGITGVSLGGIVAATAACSDPRIHRAALILAGGDLRTIVHHARETRELSVLINRLPPQDKAAVEATIDAVDPLHVATQIRDRALAGRVLMVNAAEDEVIPPECTKKLAAALGITDRVVWLDGLGHYTALAELSRIMQMTADFFAQDLPAGVTIAPPPAPRRTALQAVVTLVQQTVGFLTSEPTSGHCHFADLEVSVTPKGEKPVQGRLLLIRGAKYRFKLHCRVPMIGDVSVGQGSYPWIASLDKTVFEGTKGPATAAGDPLMFVASEHLMKLRMLGGLVAGLGLAPDLVEQLAALQEEAAPDGRKQIRVDLKKEAQGSLCLALKEDQKTPDRITFDIEGTQGVINVRSWQINTVAHDAMFAPPDGLTPKEVARDDVYRIFSAMFNFALENVR